MPPQQKRIIRDDKSVISNLASENTGPIKDRLPRFKVKYNQSITATLQAYGSNEPRGSRNTNKSRVMSHQRTTSEQHSPSKKITNNGQIVFKGNGNMDGSSVKLVLQLFETLNNIWN